MNSETEIKVKSSADQWIPSDNFDHDLSVSMIKEIKVNEDVGRSRIGRSYPALRRFFNLQLVDVDYLSFPKSSSFRFFVLGLTFLIITDFRAVWQTFYTELSTLSYYTGDISMAAGEPVRSQLATIYLIWISGSILAAFFLYYSQKNPKFQCWHHSIGQVFEHYATSNYPIYSGLSTKFLKLFIRFNILAFYSGGSLACICSLPTLYIYPREYVVYALMWLPFTWMTGVFCSVYVVTLACLYFLYVYISGLQADRLFQAFSPILDVNENDRVVNNSVTILQHCLLIRLKKIITSNVFWTILNSIFFLVSFFVQTLILYIIFFVSVPQFLSLGLIGYAILNFFCGQSLHFIFGTFAQRKINQNYSLFKQSLYSRIPFDTKIKTLIFLEYVEHRYFFTVFDSINCSSKDLILTGLEGASNLLLLIASMNGSNRKFGT